MTRATKVGVELSSSNAYFCGPVYKFLKTGFLRWLAGIDGFTKEWKAKCYAEDPFNEISKEIVL